MLLLKVICTYIGHGLHNVTSEATGISNYIYTDSVKRNKQELLHMYMYVCTYSMTATLPKPLRIRGSFTVLFFVYMTSVIVYMIFDLMCVISLL